MRDAARDARLKCGAVTRWSMAFALFQLSTTWRLPWISRHRPGLARVSQAKTVRTALATAVHGITIAVWVNTLPWLQCGDRWYEVGVDDPGRRRY
ncbi:hypothetical protein ACFTY8_45320 [Streptomyces mirabilis]|uniref:hypothetical protein n=1 Tax=Streptomyces mirabilis TaxID=68239 RepID=UPI00363E57D6